MKFFQGFDKLTAADIENNCAVITAGMHRTQYGTNSSKDGRWCKYANNVIVAATTKPGVRRLVTDEKEITNVTVHGDCTSHWYADKCFINLKYVPKKIKNAEYKSSAEYLNAVMEFLQARKDSAKGKLMIKKNNNEAAAALNFMDAQTVIDEVTTQAGWKPSKGWGDFKTMNDWHQRRGDTAFEYEKDRNHKLKFEVQKSKKNLAKITITGLDAEKSADILKALFGFMA